MDLTIVVIALIVVWYVGSAINSILGGAGELVEKEFHSFSQEQDIRLRKNRIKRAKQIDKLVDEKTYTDEEFDKIFNPGRE